MADAVVNPTKTENAGGAQLSNSTGSLSPQTTTTADRKKALVSRLVQIGGICLILVLVLAGIAAYPYLKQRIQSPSTESSTATENSLKRLAGDVLLLPDDTPSKMGLKTKQVEVATRPRLLPPMAGWLNVDNNTLVRVHSRFVGEVREVMKVNGRPLSRGDEVKKDQLLAIIWSKELGTKKSELVDALAQLRFRDEYLRNLENAEGGAVPAKLLADAQLAVDQARIAADRAERELKTSRLTKKELDDIRAEADKLARREKLSPEAEENWRRLEVRSDVDGVILEKNVGIGDIVDTSVDLFKMADLSRLVVNAHMFEDDLSKLYELQKQHGPIKWSVRLQATPDAPPQIGTVEEIGVVLDSTQHTALIQGFVPNPQRQLLIGQFVNAQIIVPPDPKENLVEVPATAVVDEGANSFVFVPQSGGLDRLERRPVSVIRRFADVVQLRSEPRPEDTVRGVKPLSVKDRVIVSGAVELNGALEDLPVPP